jgi:hypothetical protein
MGLRQLVPGQAGDVAGRQASGEGAEAAAEVESEAGAVQAEEEGAD